MDTLVTDCKDRYLSELIDPFFSITSGHPKKAAFKRKKIKKKLIFFAYSKTSFYIYTLII